MKLNWTQIKSALIKVIGFGTTYALGKGWINSDQAGQISTVLIMIAGLAYSFYDNTDESLVNAAAKVETVHSDALTPEGLALANAAPTVEVKHP